MKGVRGNGSRSIAFSLSLGTGQDQDNPLDWPKYNISALKERIIIFAMASILPPLCHLPAWRPWRCRHGHCRRRHRQPPSRPSEGNIITILQNTFRAWPSQHKTIKPQDEEIKASPTGQVNDKRERQAYIMQREGNSCLIKKGRSRKLNRMKKICSYRAR